MNRVTTSGFVLHASRKDAGLEVRTAHSTTIRDISGGYTRMARKSRKDLQRDENLSKADAKELWHNKKAGKSNKKKQHGKPRGR